MSRVDFVETVRFRSRSEAAVARGRCRWNARVAELTAIKEPRLGYHRSHMTALFSVFVDVLVSPCFPCHPSRFRAATTEL